MNELQVFNNPEFGRVRTTLINDEPYFVGKDVAIALGYERPTDAARKHIDPEDRGVAKIETPSGTQEMTVINESGLYSLILSSKLPTAKKFKRWVTSEVLPSIRKTGGYSAPQKKEPKLGEINSAARILLKTLTDAGMPPQYRAVALQGIYRPAGIDIPLIGITMPERYYSPTEIAEKLGIYSGNGKPHGQAVAALISTFELEENDRVLAPFQNQNSGHTSQNWQYSERVVGMVKEWITKHGMPNKISTPQKTFNVTYNKTQQ